MVNLEKHQQWDIPSSKGDRVYRINRWPQAEPGENTWTCDCPDYAYRQRNRLYYECKHIREVKRGLIEQFTSALEGHEVHIEPVVTTLPLQGKGPAAALGLDPLLD